MAERDYILGTHDEELQRLGLQHRVWRSTVLKAWDQAGITTGRRVLDVGAGPGYATMDLAEIVGPTGHVTAVERSGNFVQAMRASCQARGLTNVAIHELDLATDDLPAGPYDFSWCRWVLCFIEQPGEVIRKLSSVLRPGGRAIFHEYACYETWGYVPPRPYHQEFVRHIMESWSEHGGKADVAIDLPPLLEQHGLRIRSSAPHIFALRPADYMWQWPHSFIHGGTARLKELGRVDESFAAKLREELAEVEKSQNPIFLTPLVLEIVAEKL